jgi:hypothetical protein
MSAQEPGPEHPDVPLEVGGVTFQLRVFDDPSGLRGQVFDGEEKVAGVQVFHTKDVARLVEMARRDRAVARGAERRAGAARP